MGQDNFIRRIEPSSSYYRRPKARPTGYRFLSFLGKFGFKSDEAIAYNYYAAYYLDKPQRNYLLHIPPSYSAPDWVMERFPLNRITAWEHDLDESYLLDWETAPRAPFPRRF